MTHYLYALVDPLAPARVRYIGVTGNLLERRRVHRVRQHTTNRALAAWKDELLTAGRAPELRILATFATQAEALEREWRTIWRWQRRGVCDLNHERFGAQRYALFCEARHRRLAEGATKVQPTPENDETALAGGFATSTVTEG
jgi:predicted GIY-YIG superfamily endonuclease